MAYYQGILGRSGRQKEFTLVWGGVFHKLAQVWIDTQDIDQVLEIIDLNIEEETEDRYGRNRLRMQELFMAWLEFRRQEPLEILHTEQPVIVECPKGQPCPYFEDGCGLTYGGRLDQIVRWLQLVGPLDFKTTVMTDSDPLIEYKPSHQMIGYTWQTTHLMGKLCWGPIVERLICNKSKIEIGRFPVPVPRGLVEEWLETERLTHTEIRQKFADHPEDEVYWKQNFSRCAKPYLCKFRDACLSPRDMGFRYRWLRDNTVERRFDFRIDETREAQVVE